VNEPVCDHQAVQHDARQELEATVAARRELGPEHDEHLIAGFLDRIEKEIDRRVDERLAAGRRERHPRRGGGPSAPEIGVFVPLFIIAGIFGGPAGIFAVAGVLAVVLLVQMLRR
jgi:hypothetical protein